MLSVRRLLTSPSLTDPFYGITWSKRTVEVKSDAGAQVFKVNDLEFPDTWSQNAAGIVAEKYFREVEQPNKTLKKETSVREMVSRVANTITAWGKEQKYFDTETSIIFCHELTYILVHQMAMFNSPVLFNLGTKGGRIKEEQASGCFINDVQDNMESILDLVKTEGMLFKGGSGSGVNYSLLRSSREKLSNGGVASGPVPFVAAHDANAGAIKSGGGTRRAAKMAILNADHGDILEFVQCKAKAEKMAHALVDAGFEVDYRARFGAYQSVPFQNSNHSVRVTDGFMRAVESDASWNLMARNGETVLETVSARKVWNEICEATRVCGDPGLQFHTTINKWHTTPAYGEICASNPCSEFMSHPNTACNLASINLRKFLEADGSFDTETFEHVVDIMITAQDILIDGASYPKPIIAENAHRFRQLGLGYANLGALFMAQGIAYDSNRARSQCALITALMTARAYRRSAEIAHALIPYVAYVEKDHFRVIDMHFDAFSTIHIDKRDHKLVDSANNAWIEAMQLGRSCGFRNSQVTLLAPTGTIGFAMDCDTTGIEPDMGLLKSKSLVGGGSMKMENQQIDAALKTMHYDKGERDTIKEYVRNKGSVVGSPLHPIHYDVFDCSYAEPVTQRMLRPEAHILMLAAAQPHLSGAISKTCNVAKDTTAERIGELYMMAWLQGLKAIAIYRDGSKRSQPVQVKREEKTEKTEKKEKKEDATLDNQLEQLMDRLKPTGAPYAVRRRLPDERDAINHKFTIGNHEGYVTIGKYDDGTPGEMFIRMSKMGSTVSGMMEAFATVVSVALQHGVPLPLLIDKYRQTKFDPAGFCKNPKIPSATSVLDYLFRWMETKFSGDVNTEKTVESTTGDTCPDCGSLLSRTGTCTTCPQCGFSGGCG